MLKLDGGEEVTERVRSLGRMAAMSRILGGVDL